MSNTYYKYKKTQTDIGSKPNQKRVVDMELSLTAYSGGRDNPHCIQLSIDNAGDHQGEAHITLTIKEQNELIIGLLESRGVPVHITKSWLEKEGVSGWTGDGCVDISASNGEQSRIHPAEKQIK